MKLKNYMHPEMVLGLRGSKKLNLYYASALNVLSLERVNVDGQVKTLLNANLSRLPRDFTDEIVAYFEQAFNDSISLNHLSLIKLFFAEKGDIYHFPKDFAKTLSSINKKIPINNMPDDFVAYFNLPEGSLFYDGASVRGCYVYVGEPKWEVQIKDGSSYKGRCLFVSGVMNDFTVSKFVSPLEGLTPDDLYKGLLEQGLVKDAASKDPSVVDHSSRASLISFVVNACLYINSMDNNIALLKPENKLKHRERDAQRKVCPVENETSMPVKVVSWDYHTGRQFNVDGTTVQTHMRWQRCGPEHSQIKLVWVKEHERTYNKTKGIHHEESSSVSV